MTDITKVIEIGSRLVDHLKKVRPPELSSGKNKQFLAVREEIDTIFSTFGQKKIPQEAYDRVTAALSMFESYSRPELTDTNFNRSKVNVVVSSARLRSTHYAAYMAGKFSQSDEVGAKFKCWMHNAAAHGTLQMYEALTAASKAIPLTRDGASGNTNADEVVEVLNLFKVGLICDAARFVELSRTFDENAAVRLYNSGKLDILSNNHDRIKRGVDSIACIAGPRDGCHAAELVWHINNYESFSIDNLMKDYISRENGQDIVRLEAILKRNEQEAIKIRNGYTNKYGSFWENDRRAFVPYMAYASTSISIGLFFLSNPSDWNTVSEFMTDVYSYVTSFLQIHQPDSSVNTVLAKLGDGGLAGPRLARAMFGDGGLA